MKHPVYIIVAVDENLGIGSRGRLPWKLKKEMRYFADTTTKTNNPDKQNMVIMGRTTWQSLGPKYHPLKGRKNVVLSGNPNFKVKGATVAGSLDQALALADNKIEKIFILGGATVFKEVIETPSNKSANILDGIYLTKIHKIYNCDTYFPEVPKKFSRTEKLGSDEESGIRFDYLLYKA